MLLDALRSTPATPLVVVLVACCVIGAADFKYFRIPNFLTLPLFAGGVAFHALAPGGDGLAFALVGGLVGFGCLFVFYLLGGMGAGDVKLLAGAGAWLGPGGAFLLFLTGSLFAGAYSLWIAAEQGALRRTLDKVGVILRQGALLVRYLGEEERVEAVVGQDDRRKRLVPFGLMLLGGAAVLFSLRVLIDAWRLPSMTSTP